MHKFLIPRKPVTNKLLFSVLLVFYSFFVGAQTIFHPEFVMKSHPTLEIVKVVRTADQLMLHMVIRNELSRGGSFCIDKNTEIRTTGTSFKVRDIYGIPECPEAFYFQSPGEKLEFYLYFPAVPEDVRVIDIIENCPENCFSYYGVVIDEELNNKMALAFNFYESGELREAQTFYIELFTEIEGKEPRLEALLYFYIISILRENGAVDESDTWTYRFREAKIPGSEWVEEKLKEKK